MILQREIMRLNLCIKAMAGYIMSCFRDGTLSHMTKYEKSPGTQFC